jgi:hypothetical protein
MKCESCGYENDAAARFCSGCGKALDTSTGAPKSIDEYINGSEIFRETKSKNKRTYIIVFAILIIVILFMIGGPAYQYYGPCGVTKVKDSLKEISDIMNRWEDAESIASITSRVSLSGPVADLQAIKRDAEKLTMPGCMTPVKEKLTHAMEYSIKGYLAFMQEATDSAVGIYFDQAGSDMAELADLIIVIKACAPNCNDITKPRELSFVDQMTPLPSQNAFFTKTPIPSKTPTTTIKVLTKSPTPSRTSNKYFKFPTKTPSNGDGINNNFDINRCKPASSKQEKNIELSLVRKFPNSSIEKSVSIKSDNFNNLWFVAARILTSGVNQRIIGVWAMLPSEYEPEYICSINSDAIMSSGYLSCEEISKENPVIPKGISMSASEVILAELCATIE